MWAKSDSGSAINWNTANEYVKQLKNGGYSDWRLPTVLELQGLSGNNFDAIIFSKSSSILWYWSSEKTSASRARNVNLNNGNVNENDVDNSNNKGARAVRP